MLSLNRRHFLAASGAACLFAGLPKNTAAQTPDPTATLSGRKPNIIFILTDDLGFGDVGWLFQNNRGVIAKLETPALDRLAAEGVTLHDHYSCGPLCAPARASLLTGKHQGHCNLRDAMFDRPIDPSMTLGTVMKAAGYQTFCIGKWGIGGGGGSTSQIAMPWQTGFDKAFIYKMHGDGHTYYHAENEASFWDETNTKISDSIQKLRYDTDLLTARARAYMEEHLSGSESDKPFFIFLSYTAIHGSSGTKAVNAGTVNDTQFQIPGGVHDPSRLSQWPLPAETPETANTWNYPQFNAANGFDTAPKRRYATTVKRLDDCVGFLADYLKQKGIADNTLLVFTSDNGPTTEYGSNINLFISAGPFRGMKRHCYEGGLREPTLAWWPGTIPAGRVDHTPGQFQCWMPTLADLGGVPQPAHSDGVSLLPSMTGIGQQLSSRVYVEIHPASASANYGADQQMQMIREGDFVAIRRKIASKDDPIELYNVIDDEHQDQDLANDPRYSNRARYMKNLMLTCRLPHTQCQAAFGFPGYVSHARPYDGAALPAVPRRDTLPPAEVRLFTDGAADWPWVPNFRTLEPQMRFYPAALSGIFSECARRAGAAPFGASVTGWLEVSETGNYTFTGTGTGGIQLWVHEAHILEYEAGDCTAGKSITIPLEAGRHPFKLYATVLREGEAPVIRFGQQILVS